MAGERRQEQETPFEFFASTCALVVVYLFVTTFLCQNFAIPSGSMKNTLLVGDHLITDRVGFAPASGFAGFLPYREIQRGDIVVFLKPGFPGTDLVKRVIGIPGDRIHLRDGIVYRNGQALAEPQAAKPTPDNYLPFRDEFPAIPVREAYGATAAWEVEMPRHLQGEDLVVPSGQYFVMGDNRVNSADSRYWGFVPRENIIGSPLLIYWSFVTSDEEFYRTGIADKLSIWANTALHFFDQTRWKRTLLRIR
jgi:signal peptidase I